MLQRPKSIWFFIVIMSPNSEPSSDDKTPSFFLDDDKTGKNNLDFQNIADETDTNETLSNTHTTKAPE